MTRLFVIILAMVGGWVDAGSFVGLHHIMAAHITGNLVILGADIAGGFQFTDLLKIAILPVFVLAVIAVTLIHDRHMTRHEDPARRIREMLVVEAALIAATGLLGLLVTLQGWTLGFWLSLAVATPLTCGMALQNAIHRLYPVVGPATTVMTGNITQFVMDRTRGLTGLSSHSLINDMPRDALLLPVLILAFGTGCVLGAVTTMRLGNGAFLVPAALVLAAIPWCRKPSRA